MKGYIGTDASDRAAMLARGAIAFGFDVPREVGEVVTSGYNTDRNGERLPPTPLLILAPATYEDWRAGVDCVGSRAAYFYWVTTD
jgi:hypothetical protein